MAILPSNFDSWDTETKEAVRYVWSKRPHARVSGHGYDLYVLVPNADTTPSSPSHVSLGLEVTLPKSWTWEKAEPFMWRMAAAFLKQQ